MTTQSVLVTGGAGYIGSHMVNCLINNGFSPIVIDDLSHGHKENVSKCKLIIGSIHDTDLLHYLFSQHHITAVMHFAAFISVTESVKNPGKYYQNNFVGTLNLLDTMLKHKVNKIIFSSTAAVYGEPVSTPIDEQHPISPLTPYGKSKWMAEQLIEDYAKAHGLQYIILRYFNAAGSDPTDLVAECHDPETHLIPLILQVALGEKDHIAIYGNDYQTIDGTCVRDYIHVSDLCSAHLLSLNSLLENNKNAIYNLGTAKGYTVQQIIEMTKTITQCDIPTIVNACRLGDPAVLVADPSKIMQDLLWKIKYPKTEIIIQHAWNAIKKVKQKHYDNIS